MPLRYSEGIERFDSDTLRYALQVARKRGFRTVRLEFDSEEFRATLSPAVPVAPASRQPEPSSAITEMAASETGQAIEAPAVGFYRPKRALEPGDRVSAGEVVGAVVALGIANDVVSPLDGMVESVAVNAEEPVMYGQTIVTLRREEA